MPKNALRTRMLATRDRLGSDERLQAGSLILKTLSLLPEYEAAATVALYAAFRGEVPTGEMIRQALAAGKEVLLPAVVGNGLVFRRIEGEGDLAPGRFGIEEPKACCSEVAPEVVDLFVIPGVAFDLKGNRVGYGKGYYDRSLHRFEASGGLIGICYDFQLVDEIVGQPHDVIMDRVITERRVVPPCC